MPDTHLIFRDVAASLPAEYEVEPGMEIEIASVRARIDGAGASGTFIPVLEVLSQAGNIMAQVRPDQEFAVADTGVVTYAPF